ncbi:YchJ family metal-binding protein [Demequina sp. B12]|uniref:YchJ family protein n=1 Tax=Demequina sp. B12 TaxID=2992757 RepID=UPI00237C496E|nr:YchJ family metal-binding protein [Demequina sp. B12]MDE0572081.1 YchJ family metal-binding protein [Demequina sp. B12]
MTSSPGSGPACPCGSGETYSACCRPYLRREAEAPTAEALMRSRYTAYVRRDAAYLEHTWHPQTYVPVGDLRSPVWRGLSVGAVEDGKPGDSHGVVEFTAHFEDDAGHAGNMRETSRFVFEQGRWLYLDGDVS